MLSNDLASFQSYLCSSKRILALVGAGLSASSNLPTFRGSGGLWREYDAMDLATPDAFQDDPSLVWQFYSARREAALRAKPNNGHYALAQLARKLKERFLTVTQNVDGLSLRANHPVDQLVALHGDLFTVKCTSFMCSYSEIDFTQPLVPALAAKSGDPLKDIPVEELPTCPRCHSGLLRPGVVWFGEPIPLLAMTKANTFMSDKVDLILVIGTSGTVYPAAGFVDDVCVGGGKVAIFNIEMDGSSADLDGWYFEGDAAKTLPKALEVLIGAIRKR